MLSDVFKIGYYNWWLVAAYIVILAVFLYGILQPRKRTEWKSAGIAQAWVIALYAEMYGVPLTAYFAMSMLGRNSADAETHFNGHLWPVFFKLNQTATVWAQFGCTVVGQSMILVGAALAIIGWRQIYRAVNSGVLAQSGVYKYIRHPQYTGFFLFLLGSIINWPTLPTLLTLPILWLVYLKLARSEEQDAIETFGDEYLDYIGRTGRFIPRFNLLLA